jgi:hypothetical protein
MNGCNLSIYQGDDWAGWITVLNCADGTPADLTGFSAQGQIRTGPADQSRYVAAEMLATVVPRNHISLYLTSAQTAVLRGLYYCWDLQLISPSNMTTTLMGGDVQVSAEVTRESQGVQAWAAIPISPQRWLQEFPYRDQPGLLVPLVVPAR